MTTYRELMAQKEALEAKLAEVRAHEIAAIVDQIRSLMAEYDLTVDDIALPRRRGRPAGTKARTGDGRTVPPKYRDPKTGKTWSGRGRAPAWLGKNRNRFLIAEE